MKEFYLKDNMKKQKQRYVRTKLERKPRFEVGAIAPVASRGVLETELEELKARLLKPLIDEAKDPADAAPLRLAANEAAGLAWFTPFPLLFLPALLEEKVYAAQRQEARQRQIREKTESLLDLARN
jgi:hypothetical protein